jgi:hypothetical protein
LEVERESLRARQLRARDLLRGDLEGQDLEEYVEQRLLTTTLENALNWGRANAIFPLTFGLACCAIEQISLVTARYDIARFGAEAFRATPRQADLLILSGRVSIKMAPVVRRVYDQMLEPKWVIALNKLQKLVRGKPDLGWRQRYNAGGTEEWARFESGEPTKEALERAARAVEDAPGREAEDAP